MRVKLMFLIAFLLAFGSTAASAGEDDGKVAFNNHCRTCHSIRENDNRLGPTLFGVVGRPAGQANGYRGYSGGFNGIVWDESMLDRLMADPSVSANTNMIFPPVLDVRERNKIISFLKTLVRR